MPDPMEFVRQQDAELEKLRRIFQVNAQEYSLAVTTNASHEAQVKAFFAMVSGGRELYRKCEEVVSDRGGLQGNEYETWLNKRIADSESVLNGLIQYHRSIRRERERLKLAANSFEPSPTAYQNMQGVLAATRPEKASLLKTNFEAENLPITGFEKPYKPRPATSIHMKFFLTIIIMFGILALACIAGGFYAIYKGATADTSFDFLGFHLKSTHVGVAFVGIGLTSAIIITREVLKKIKPM